MATDYFGSKKGKANVSTTTYDMVTPPDSVSLQRSIPSLTWWASIYVISECRQR